MGAMINGLVQGIRYGSSEERIYFRPIVAGVDTGPDALTDISCTIYDKNGDAILSDEDLTIVSGSPWYYVDIDASATATWAIGYGYRMMVVWYASTILQVQNILLDVVASPFNDPLVSTAQFDTEHPGWSDARATGWTTWAPAILIAHLELCRDLRDLKDNTGTYVYPNRIIDRGALERVEMAYTERVAVMQGMRADESLQKHYCAKAVAAFRSMSTLDLHEISDDDLEDGSEAYIGGIQFER